MFALIYSCSKKTMFDEENDREIICASSIFDSNTETEILIPDDNNSVLWKGYYTDTTVKIYFTRNLGVDKETETLNFIFNKVEGCLQVNRGYEYYFGSYAGISALTEVEVIDLQITEWDVNKMLNGKVSYIDHHDKEVYIRDFKIAFTEEDYVIENTDFNYFPECFSNKLPLNIDLDNDSVTDYQIIAEETENIGNMPNYIRYTLKLISVDETVNEILSPKGINPPFPVIFEPPFSSENTRKYDANRFNSADVRNALDVFYEFNTPYENYNFFLNNNLTNRKEFANTLDDYYLVRLKRNNSYFYGWIKIDFNALACDIEILDTFFNTNANQHVSVD